MLVKKLYSTHHECYPLMGNPGMKEELCSPNTRSYGTQPRSWGPLYIWNWGHMTIALQALSLVEKTEAVQICFTLHLRDQLSKWKQDGCKVYKDSYMASNGACFMVTWIISKNHLLEIGLTQNRETMALQSLTTIEFLHFIVYEDPLWIEIHWNDIWLRAQSHMASHYSWGPVTTLRDFGSILGRPLCTSFGLPQFLGYSSWLVCEVAPSKLMFWMSMANCARNMGWW